MFAGSDLPHERVAIVGRKVSDSQKVLESFLCDGWTRNRLFHQNHANECHNWATKHTNSSLDKNLFPECKNLVLCLSQSFAILSLFPRPNQSTRIISCLAVVAGHFVATCGNLARTQFAGWQIDMNCSFISDCSSTANSHSRPLHFAVFTQTSIENVHWLPDAKVTTHEQTKRACWRQDEVTKLAQEFQVSSCFTPTDPGGVPPPCPPGFARAACSVGENKTVCPFTLPFRKRQPSLDVICEGEETWNYFSKANDLLPGFRQYPRREMTI